MADDVDPAAWAAFGSCEGTRVVVTRMPRVMVDRFAREHLGAHAVVGCDLEYSRLRRSTGLLRGASYEDVATRVRALFAGDGCRPALGIGGSKMARSFLTFCEVRDLSSSSRPSCHLRPPAYIYKISTDMNKVHNYSTSP
jgi:glycerol-3-phosphate acyltransferase